MRGRNGRTSTGKALLALALLFALWWAATHRNPSDWRYPKMLISQIPKMPFRYFV